MTFEPIDDHLLHKLERSLGQPNHTSASPGAPAPPAGSPAPIPTGLFLLSDVPSKPLSWLWPGRIPLGHLTLLDAAPGCGLSLLALTLAACVSRGSPLPDGTPTQQGPVILLAPHDSASDTIKPRLEAAGGDPAHVLLFCPLVEDASHALSRTRPFAFPQDLDHLATMIRCLQARLVILDPASAIPGLVRCLPALIELAHQTNCAILLTRSLQKPPADPLHSPGPPSALMEAARSRLLLTPDPSDERHHLLLTTRHPLCPQPTILAYDILASAAGIPLIHWLGERDYAQLARLCTGPLRSPHRQAILRFLQNSPSPQSIPEILKATCYDHEAGRKMLLRMKMAGELVSPARGLYTTANHPCLAHLTPDPPVVPTVPSVPDLEGFSPKVESEAMPGVRRGPIMQIDKLPQPDRRQCHPERSEGSLGQSLSDSFLNIHSRAPIDQGHHVANGSHPSPMDQPSPSVPNVPPTTDKLIETSAGSDASCPSETSVGASAELAERVSIPSCPSPLDQPVPPSQTFPSSIISPPPL